MDKGSIESKRKRANISIYSGFALLAASGLGMLHEKIIYGKNPVNIYDVIDIGERGLRIHHETIEAMLITASLFLFGYGIYQYLKKR